MSENNLENNLENKKNLPLWFYIKTALTFRYISNLSIIICILSYYMDALNIFFIFAPLIIVNFIMITLILINDYDAFIICILGNIYPDKKDRDEQSYFLVLFIIFYHLLPVLWLLYIIQKDDLIKIFHPNFMSIFFKSAILPIIYYYFEIELKVYGDINYLFYSIIYFILLLATCYYLYAK